MENFEQKIKQLIEMMGFGDFSVNQSAENGRFSIFINDDLISEKNLPNMVNNFECVLKLMAQKNGIESIFIDVNNYRKKREGLILDLARATARRAVVEKKEMPLPAMNAYERRLVHTELSKHPDIKTDSVGEGKERYIVIKPI
ncbi:hypothetical protein HZC33_03610 [Candidatus Wolfebacteria bacterium]|nr:hypothetical protein [Candidatus Wolfebacteria bacterium]